jgi:hypothetical protein
MELPIRIFLLYQRKSLRYLKKINLSFLKKKVNERLAKYPKRINWKTTKIHKAIKKLKGLKNLKGLEKDKPTYSSNYCKL